MLYPHTNPVETNTNNIQKHALFVCSVLWCLLEGVCAEVAGRFSLLHCLFGLSSVAILTQKEVSWLSRIWVLPSFQNENQLLICNDCFAPLPVKMKSYNLV